MPDKTSVYVLKVGESPPSWYHRIGLQPLYRSDEERDKPIFYHFWCIKGAKEVVVIDTGIPPDQTNNVENYESPVSLLAQIGVDAKKVEKVIITHLHPNHFSGFYLFDNADFYIQENEFRSQAKHIAEKKFLREKALLPPQLQEDLKDLSCVQRIHYVNGDEKITNDINVHLVGGHTPGLQAVSVESASGTVVMCSDIAYLYRNIVEETPVGSFWNLQQACEGLQKVKQIARSERLLLPSHDPLIWDGRYPLLTPRIAKIA